MQPSITDDSQNSSDEILIDDTPIIAQQNAAFAIQVVFFQPRSYVLGAFYEDVLISVFLLVVVIVITFVILYQQIAQTQRIQQSESELRTLTNNISDFVIRFNRDLQHVYVNPALLAAVQIPAETYLGKTNQQLGFPPENVQYWDQEISRVFESGNSNTIEFCVEMPSGERWYQAKLTPEFHEQTVHTVLSVVRDITEPRQAEAQRLAAERATIELEEQQKAIELKERFIATASHDFRTPLTIIQTSTYLLENYIQRNQPEKVNLKLTHIQEQVTHMTRLLDDVLAISKTHADKTEVVLEDVVLSDFCSSIWQNVVTIDQGEHLKELTIHTDIKTFTADPELLKHVFDNLLSNALKYTPAGKLIQFIVEDDEAWMIFSVVDHGYGIPTEDQPLLFEPFHRARNVTSIRGTGLGLTIVKDFVELHHGTVTITSKEGEGSTFIVRLPKRRPNT